VDPGSNPGRSTNLLAGDAFCDVFEDFFKTVDNDVVFILGMVPYYVFSHLMQKKEGVVVFGVFALRPIVLETGYYVKDVDYIV